MGRIPTKQNPNPWEEESSDKKKVRIGSTAMTRGLTGRNYQRKCYVRDLCVDWQQKYSQKLRPVCPALKKWVNEEKLSDMANIQKTNSTMLDSINRILLVFGRLIQWTPTEKIVAWCAHRKNILEECLSFVEQDLSLLPKRLESSYPETSKRCDQLIGQLIIDRTRYKFHHPQSLLYLMPPHSARSHYFLILDWRQKQMVIAKGLEAIEMNRLTSPYPAEAVKTMNEIYQELASLAQIITEKPAGTEVQAEAKQDAEGCKNLLQIANSVHKWVQNELKKRYFQKHIVAFRKAKNKFAQALKEAQKAAKADPKLRYDYDEVRDKDKDAPKPPQKDYEVEFHHVLDDYPKEYWRPKLPFNPDGWLLRFQCKWLGFFHPPAEEPRNKDDRLICEYALLAAIHDEALDIPACNRLTDRDKDDWVESLWENVSHGGVTMDDLLTYGERMRNINTAFNDVEADLAKQPAETKLEIEPVEAPKQNTFIRGRNTIRLNFTIWNKDDNYNLLLHIINDSTRGGIPVKNRRKLNTLKERLKKAGNTYEEEDYNKFAKSLKYKGGLIYTEMPPGMIIPKIK